MKKKDIEDIPKPQERKASYRAGVVHHKDTLEGEYTGLRGDALVATSDAWGTVRVYNPRERTEHGSTKTLLFFDDKEDFFAFVDMLNAFKYEYSKLYEK